MKILSKDNLLLVSIIIPCRNEEKLIGKCLDSLLSQNFPKEKIEILVIDGRSEDKTREIVNQYKNNYSFIKLIDNSQKFQVFALNKGIKASKGEIIIRCDAHAEYSRNYIEKLVNWLLGDKRIGNVGGVCINKPIKNSLGTRAIAYTLAHPFCVGPNRFRIGAKKIIFVDTVPFGAWRKEIFKEVGFFDPIFLKAEDLNFNIRLKKAGYKILLDPDIRIIYYPRDSFKKLYSMLFDYAYWKVFIIKKLKVIPSLRQFAPPLFILYLFLALVFSFSTLLVWIPLGIYIFLSLIFSLQISLKHGDIKILPFIFLTFIVSHISYGIGYWKGVCCILFEAPKKDL